MGSAKDIIIKPIKASAANAIIKKIHYSGKVVANSQLHLGVFLNGVLEGAMQFGPSLDKSKIKGLVRETKWNDFIELNRMAFSDKLPRNSESRAIGYAVRLIKKNYTNIKWIISFSDGTQCGDGTIYRASGFYLVGIKESKDLRIEPSTGKVMHKMQAYHLMIESEWREWEKTIGYQLKYIYFINKDCKQKLTSPIIPFSRIDEIGAGMYKGKNVSIKNRREKQAN